MAIYIGVGKPNVSIISGSLRMISFSGTVRVDGDPAEREIIGIKKIVPTTFYKTMSDAAGDWSLEMPGGTNDEFRIICVGLEGENSGIYEHLQG